ncbi:hypothetical protein Vretifemale_16759 [Volvox reticuliferus]|nr:hypothetical protein Vretifemale_16759 [Volvox reticuliferus]
MDSTHCGMIWSPPQLPGQMGSAAPPMAATTAAVTAAAVSVPIASGPLPSFPSGPGLPLPFPFSFPFPLPMPMPMAMPMHVPMAMPPPLAAFHMAAAATAAAATLAAQHQAVTQAGLGTAGGLPNSFEVAGPGAFSLPPAIEYWRHMAPLVGPMFPLHLPPQPPYPYPHQQAHPRPHSHPPSDLEAPGGQGQQQQEGMHAPLKGELGAETLADSARTKGQRSSQRVVTALVSELILESGADPDQVMKRGPVGLPSQARRDLVDGGLAHPSQTLLLPASAPAPASPQVQQHQYASSKQAMKQPLSQRPGQRKPHPQKHRPEYHPHLRPLIEAHLRSHQENARALTGSGGTEQVHDSAGAAPGPLPHARSTGSEGHGDGGGGTWSHVGIAARGRRGGGGGGGHQSSGSLTQRKRKVASLGGSASESGRGEQSRAGSDAESGGGSGGGAAPVTAIARAVPSPSLTTSHERPPFRYIVRIGSKWRAQVGHTEDGVQRKYYSNYVDDPRVAAKDADRILYKLRGLPAVANSQLSEAERAALDTISLEALMRSFKSDQRQLQQQQ